MSWQLCLLCPHPTKKQNKTKKKPGACQLQLFFKTVIQIAAMKLFKSKNNWKNKIRYATPRSTQMCKYALTDQIRELT